MVVISPWTRRNFVSGNLTNTASIVQLHRGQLAELGDHRGFLRRRPPAAWTSGALLDFHARPHFTPLILNPATGAVVSGGSGSHGNKG